MKISIVGIKIDALKFNDVINRVEEYMRDGKKHIIVTPNPEMIVMAYKDREFFNILNNADLAISDGIGLRLGAFLLGKNIPERVTGTDLVDKIAAISHKKNIRIYLLGAAEGVAAKAAEELLNKYGALIAGSYSGSYSVADEHEIISRINKTKADVLFVAFGAVNQEKWIHRNMDKLHIKLAIGIGGALDYVSKKKSRAPLWVQKIGLEWFYRLICEPQRFRRQIRLPHFLFLVLRERFGLFDRNNG